LNTLGRYCAVLFTYAVLNAAGLAFLGFNQPGEPEWGAMLAEARATFRASPWPALASGLALTLLIAAALTLTRESDVTTR
jgi:peptide/nickel transport system permease protein